MKIVNQDFEKYAEIKPFNKKIASMWRTVFQDSCKKINKFPSQIKILDYGCGDGKYFDEFRKYGIKQTNIFGVEVSKKRIQRCKKIGMKNTYLIDGISPLPFKNNSFDIINMMEVIEHIPIYLSYSTLKEIARVTRTSGILLISTPNYPTKRFYDFFEAIVNGKKDRFHDDPTHVTKYNYKSLKKFLSEEFSIIKKQEFKNGFLYKHLPINFFLHKIFFCCQK